METYLMELTRLSEEVQEAGIALDDGELTLIALNDLDASYDVFVTAQTARADHIAFAAFQGLLQAHKERYFCSAITLIPMANTISGNPVICQICMKKSHTAISCYNRHNESRFPTVVDKKPRYRPRSGVLGQKPNSSDNAIWYPDSGATDHITGNPSDSHLHGPVLATPSVQIANGSENE